MSKESVFLENLSADLKPFADKSDCCTFIVRLRKENEQLKSQLQQKENIIKEVRELLNQEWYSVLRKETITKAREILDKGE